MQFWLFFFSICFCAEQEMHFLGVFFEVIAPAFPSCWLQPPPWSFLGFALLLLMQLWLWL
jgi:hypothetical protein